MYITKKNIINATGSDTRQTLAPQGKEIPDEIIDNTTLTPMNLNHPNAVGQFSLPKTGKTLAKPSATQKEAEQARLR